LALALLLQSAAQGLHAVERRDSASPSHTPRKVLVAETNRVTSAQSRQGNSALVKESCNGK